MEEMDDREIWRVRRNGGRGGGLPGVPLTVPVGSSNLPFFLMTT